MPGRFRLGAFGQAEHIDGPVHIGLHRLHGVMLIVDRRRRTSEVVDLVDLHIKREGNVVTEHLKARIVKKMQHIVARTGVVVVHAEDVIAFSQKPFAQE